MNNSTIRKNKALMGALPLLAQALGRSMGVKVVMGGDEAYTDGKTITLPQLAVDDDDTSALAMGYLDHECGHVRATDFEARSKAESMTPLQHHIWNCLEDVRVEQTMGSIYPGCRINLAVLVKKLVRMGHFSAVDETNPGNLVSGYLLYSLRNRVLGQTGLDDLTQDATDKLDAAYPGLRAELDKATAQVGAAASTQDCIDISGAVLEVMKKYIQEPPEQPEPPKPSEESSSQEQDDPDDNGEAGGGNGSGESEDQSSPSQSDSAGQGGDSSPSTEQSESDDSGEGQGGDQAGNEWSQELAQTLEQALDANDEDLVKNLGEILKEQLDEKSEKQRYHANGCAGCEPASSVAAVSLDANAVRAETNALRVRLRGLLQAKVQCRRLPRRTGRKLDAKKLTRLYAGIDQKVFRGRDDKKGINTAVHVLLDRSGSMDGWEIHVANNCMLAVKLALEGQRGVNLGLSAFPAMELGAGYVPLLVHGQRSNSTKIGMSANGGTPLGEALWGVAMQMFPLKEERKIILVLTDGDPHNEGLVHKTIRSLERVGIEMVGIGIQHPNVSRFFKNHCVIDSVSGLPKALFGQLEKLLV